MAAERDPSVVRTPWFRREPIDLGGVLVETVAVVLGILLALAINDWHQRREEGATVASAVQSIHAETVRNRDAVLRYQRHLDGMADAIEHGNPADATPRPCSGWNGWSGVQQPMLLDTAYDVAIVTQALAKMPFAQARAVGETYGAQRYVQRLYEQVGAMLLAERPAPVGFCVGMSREMARASAGLARRYDGFLRAAGDARAE